MALARGRTRLRHVPSSVYRVASRNLPRSARTLYFKMSNAGMSFMCIALVLSGQSGARGRYRVARFEWAESGPGSCGCLKLALDVVRDARLGEYRIRSSPGRGELLRLFVPFTVGRRRVGRSSPPWTVGWSSCSCIGLWAQSFTAPVA